MKELLTTLHQQNYLSRATAKETLLEISEGKHNSAQVASFLSVYQMRNITLAEMQGFREAMLEKMIHINLDVPDIIDLCGTGGDGKNTFNISTLASFVVAGAGAKVAKHGNYGISSGCGSSNVLEYLGYRFSVTENKLNKELERANICFLHAPLFHPAMKNIAPIRKDLATRTFFNMLGPMINPAKPNNQLIGVFNLKVARIYHYLYQQFPCRYSIIYSMDGYDEVSLTGMYKNFAQLKEENVCPEDRALPLVHPYEIIGGNTIQESTDIFLSILQGRGTVAQNAVVIANAAEALLVLNPDKSFAECKSLAEESLFRGNALNSMKELLKNQA